MWGIVLASLGGLGALIAAFVWGNRTGRAKAVLRFDRSRAKRRTELARIVEAKIKERQAQLETDVATITTGVETIIADPVTTREDLRAALFEADREWDNKDDT